MTYAKHVVFDGFFLVALLPEVFLRFSALQCVALFLRDEAKLSLVEKQSMQSDSSWCAASSAVFQPPCKGKSATDRPWRHGWTEMSHRRGGGKKRKEKSWAGLVVMVGVSPVAHRKVRYLVNWNVTELQSSFFLLTLFYKHGMKCFNPLHTKIPSRKKTTCYC